MFFKKTKTNRSFDREPRRLLFFGPSVIDSPIAIQTLIEDTRLQPLITLSESLVQKHMGWSLLGRLHGENGTEEISSFEGRWIEECLYQLCLFELLKSVGFRFNVVSGLSMGEIAAAYATGCFGFAEAVALCCATSKSLRHPRDTDLLIIHAPESKVRQLMANQKIECYCGIHARGYSGWSGWIREIEKLDDLAQKSGLKAKRSFVNCAPHSPLIDTFEISKIIGDFRLQPPSLPYYSTITGTLVSTVPDISFWGTLVTGPSLFMETINALGACDLDEIIYIGSVRHKAVTSDLLALPSHNTEPPSLRDIQEVLDMAPVS